MIEFFRFVRHAHNCDFLAAMWNQGPCDCGLHEMLVNAMPDEVEIIRGSTPDDNVGWDRVLKLRDIKRV